VIETADRTIGQAFEDAAAKFAKKDFLVLPRDPDRPYDPGGRTLTYSAAAALIAGYRKALQAAGYGRGHRIALLLGNRLEIMALKLAMNGLGVSWVPVNPDYRPAELGYLLQDSGAAFLIAGQEFMELAAAGVAESGRDMPLVTLADGWTPPPAPSPAQAGATTPSDEASLLYTSGTTGKPKGCILSHEYELEVGRWYAAIGGVMALAPDERIYNPLPLFHLNAAVVSFFGLMLTGGCQIATARFSARRWGPEIRETQATAAHYLGIVIPALMNLPPGPEDRDHGLRWAAGAGVEPSLHGPFEERFGYPLVELWGMTEMCRVFADAEEPRSIHTHAFGRPRPGVEVRVVDQNDNDVPPGTPGEMLLRHSAETPRKGAFSGYLNLPEATEEAWRGGWLHTGDTVTQDETGLVYFVDRKKNIIRRSGENIAAAEIEAVLQARDDVAQVAVLAVEDEMRDEEVMACIVPQDETGDAAFARRLFDHCFEKLAYYKAPGWVVFVNDLPVTGTQKISKHLIFKDGEDPRARASAYDLRDLKRR